MGCMKVLQGSMLGTELIQCTYLICCSPCSQFGVDYAHEHPVHTVAGNCVASTPARDSKLATFTEAYTASIPVILTSRGLVVNPRQENKGMLQKVHKQTNPRL